MRYNEIDLAYIAGFLDGEGSFIITYQGESKRRLRPMISVANTSREILEWIKELFGGFISANNGSICKPRGRTIYYYSLGSRKACLEVLQLVIPYLKVKKKQAILLIEFCKKPPRSPYTVEDWERFKLIKKLNRRIPYRG